MLHFLMRLLRNSKSAPAMLSPALIAFFTSARRTFRFYLVTLPINSPIAANEVPRGAWHPNTSPCQHRLDAAAICDQRARRTATSGAERFGSPLVLLPPVLPPLSARFPHAPPASTLPPSLCLRLYRLSWRLQTFAPPRASWHGPRHPARQWTPCALEG